jgi:hypothetical protein
LVSWSFAERGWYHSKHFTRALPPVGPVRIYSPGQGNRRGSELARLAGRRRIDNEPPAPDELELSVFGRGFGEAICSHVGDGAWILVDSCLDPRTGEPAALTYLTKLGLSLADVVELIVVTHYDDDHIRGIGKLVEVANAATVVCSAALRREDIFEFVSEQEAAAGASGSGVDELRTLLRTCHGRGSRMIWAKSNLPLHPNPPGDKPAVVALSPSEDAVERSIEALIEAATQKRSTVPRRFRAPEGPNGASVATSVRREDIAILLGADLITSANPETGWEAVLKYARPTTRASVVKVPHHGSDGAHHERMWADLLEEKPIAIVTPWTKGNGYLPRDEDLLRLRKLAGRVFLTAMPSLRRARKDTEVRKLIQKVHGEPIDELTGWGHVRACRRKGAMEWTIDLDGDAREVPRDDS